MKKPSLAVIFWTLCITCMIWMILITKGQMKTEKPTKMHTEMHGTVINANNR
jgi:predicted DCC family thiol-disulfide oxidoreductase YuxK